MDSSGREGPLSTSEKSSSLSAESPIQAASAPVLDTLSKWSPSKSNIPGEGLLDVKTAKVWNTESLPRRFAVDATSALAAGGLVAPLIAIIDKAIIENASGKREMAPSFRASARTLLFRPHIFFTSLPFRLILMVYGGTYLTANCLDTAKSTINNRPASATTSGPAKFAATSTANLSLTMVKDSQFAKIFGTVSKRPIPSATYALFAIRDSLTIFASFNLPPIVAPMLPMSEAMEKYAGRATAAQFLTPAAVQLISTPLHLFGLDLYNRNGDTTIRDRLRKVRVDWLKSSLARMARIVPAFGIGGVVNTRVRAKLMKELES